MLQNKTREEDGLLLHLIFSCYLFYVCVANYMFVFGEGKVFLSFSFFSLLLYVLQCASPQVPKV